MARDLIHAPFIRTISNRHALIAFNVSMKESGLVLDREQAKKDWTEQKVIPVHEPLLAYDLFPHKNNFLFPAGPESYPYMCFVNCICLEAFHFSRPSPPSFTVS